MKATGIVRKTDPLGRVVLPIELRRTLGIAEQDALEIFTDGNSIILKKYQPGCVICGGMNNLVAVHNTAICGHCVASAAEKL